MKRGGNFFIFCRILHHVMFSSFQYKRPVNIQDSWRLIDRGVGHTTRISESIITVEDLETIDAGNYVCVAQNLRGQTTVATQVELIWGLQADGTRNRLTSFWLALKLELEIHWTKIIIYWILYELKLSIKETGNQHSTSISKLCRRKEMYGSEFASVVNSLDCYRDAIIGHQPLHSSCCIFTTEMLVIFTEYTVKIYIISLQSTKPKRIISYLCVFVSAYEWYIFKPFSPTVIWRVINFYMII